MSEQERESSPDATGIPEPELRGRRAFLVSLGKWSKAVIGGVVLGGLLTPEREARAWGWGNGGGGNGSWVNVRGGWGGRPYGGWYNRPWYNRPWYNRPWYNRPWYNGPGWGGSWINR